MSDNHELSAATQEQRARDHDAHNAYVPAGGLPVVPTSSLTLDAFATDAYVPEGVAGQEELKFIRQAAVLLTMTAVDGNHWIAFDVSTTASRVGWTRPAFGAHYLIQQAATQPADTDGLHVAIKVVVADPGGGSEITVVTPFAFRSPIDALTQTHTITSWGAVDGAADVRIPFQNAVNAVALQNGSIVWVPPGTWNIISQAGTATVTLPGDDGTVAAGFGTTLSAEATVTMPYSVNVPFGVRIIGPSRDSCIIRGAWKEYANATLDTGQISVTQLILFVINAGLGATSDIEFSHLRIQDAFIGIYHDGILTQSHFSHLLFQNCAFPTTTDRQEQCTWEHIQLTGCGSSLVNGGWWRQRNNAQDEFNGGWCDKTTFKNIRNVPGRDHTTFEDALDDFWDINFFKSANNGISQDNAVTITRSGSIATVTDTAHGLSSGQFVSIRGAIETDYNGTFVISNVATDTYDYTVPGSPGTPATGAPFSFAIVGGRLSQPLDSVNSFVEFQAYRGIVQAGIVWFGRTGRASFTSSIDTLFHAIASRYPIYAQVHGCTFTNLHFERIGEADKTLQDTFGVDFPNPYLPGKLEGILSFVVGGRISKVQTMNTLNSRALRLLSVRDGGVDGDPLELLDWQGVLPVTVNIDNIQPRTRIFSLDFNVGSITPQKPILFPGRTVPLSDFEEGDFTPGLQGSISNPSITFVTRTGSFTRINKTVHAYFTMLTSAFSGGSGVLRLTGLPFTLTTVTGSAAPVHGNITLLGTTVTLGMAESGGFAVWVESGSAIATALLQVGAWAATGEMRGWIIYDVA